jgi:hypothetical protein
MLGEMAVDCRAGGRAPFNPRAVQGKMSDVSVRHCGELLHPKHQPAAVLFI